MVFGRISGGHINPAVTIGLAATGDFPWGDVLPYIIAQLVGAIIGALGIAIIYGQVASTVGHLGAPSLSSTTSVGQGFIAEAVGAGILMFAVFAMAVDKRAPGGWAGLVIGLTLTAAVLMAGPATGGSLNPARAFGPYLVNVFFGTSVNWGDFILCYTVGPILGMIGAAFLYRYVAQMGRPEEVAGRARPPVPDQSPQSPWIPARVPPPERPAFSLQAAQEPNRIASASQPTPQPADYSQHEAEPGSQKLVCRNQEDYAPGKRCREHSGPGEPRRYSSGAGDAFILAPT